MSVFSKVKVATEFLNRRHQSLLLIYQHIMIRAFLGGRSSEFETVGDPSLGQSDINFGVGLCEMLLWERATKRLQ